MLEITKAALKDKLRNKILYYVCLMGIIIALFVVLNAKIKWDGKIVNNFKTQAAIITSIISFFACVLSILLSSNTIPNEYERKTSHLLFIRGVRRWQYTFSLTASNVIISIISLFLLSLSLIILSVIKNEIGHLRYIAGTIAILSINVVVLSVITSFLSKNISAIAAGFFGLMFYFVGILHDTIEILTKTIGSSKIIHYILLVVPNLSDVQKQAGHFMDGNRIDIYPLVVQVLYMYIILSLVLVVPGRRLD